MKNHRQPSVMKHAFSQVPKAEIPRSSFDRSHGYKTTFNAGELIPFFVDEALPGDTFNLRATGFSRMATPIFPIMDNLFMDTQFFAVPIRLIWDNWQKFNGEQNKPGDSTDYTIPQCFPPGGTGWVEGSIGDYFGLPTKVGGYSASALFFRAYNLIWNEWYRDENLQDPVEVHTDDGPDPAGVYSILRRGKRHDYFTSCLPWPQKGPGVTIPLGGYAPVIGNNQNSFVLGGAGTGVPNPLFADSGGAIKASVDPGNLRWSLDPSQTGNNTGLIADLSAATAATINSLRQAFQIQKIYERDARGGTRYTEILKAHFGVTSPDARLQRPEFLGGGSTPVQIAPVAQTSGTSGSGGYTPTPQGNLAAIGTSLFTGHGFNHSFTEHCVVIGIVSVRADLTYQQGLNRMWSRKTRFDYYWPALAHIGEQAVLNKEIFMKGVPVDDDAVFGYQERYAEYRYKPSQITGLFRSNATGTLDSWHLSQHFLTAPVLNDQFITENPPVDRVIATPDEPQFLFDGYLSYRCARPMPVFGVPGYIDHF
ncbi:MAG: major capsid protein [Microvirus sp.]|nr:MAG: major capsid protein [Microvirus sp.]